MPAIHPEFTPFDGRVFTPYEKLPPRDVCCGIAGIKRNSDEEVRGDAAVFNPVDPS